ncbi:MAG: hypothetical protein ACI8Y7_001123 [Candidatus Woesearchaeota archaeon]|jgi:hypothetical protein
MSLLGPAWLTSQLGAIALLTSVTILVIFSTFVNKHIIFPLTDYVKHSSRRAAAKKTKTSASHWIAKSLAALVFLIYCYFGSTVLAKYIIGPILGASRNFLVIVIIALFILLAHLLDNKRLRSILF